MSGKRDSCSGKLNAPIPVAIDYIFLLLPFQRPAAPYSIRALPRAANLIATSVCPYLRRRNRNRYLRSQGRMHSRGRTAARSMPSVASAKRSKSTSWSLRKRQIKEPRPIVPPVRGGRRLIRDLVRATPRSVAADSVRRPAATLTTVTTKR